ncbi:MAG TPA: DUF58 domain-containing protein, partial [Acidimicrobiales bacterium]|nr:DUF58 domain-containing protein [Acidimicrobiales bacterium]
SATTIDRLDLGIPSPWHLRVASGYLPIALRVDAGEPSRVELELVAERWGTWVLGPIAARSTDPAGFYVFEGRVGEGLTVQARPSRERIKSLIRTERVSVASGDQTAKVRADGIEFADIRPYVAGDRPGRVNWRVTARHGSLHVNDYHPERSTDVVLFIDSFVEAGLEETVRIAAVLATSYLRSRDRVGLVGFGGVLTWIEPSGGGLQAERIVDALTATDTFVSYAWKTVEGVPRRTLPPQALVIAISPLLDDRTVTAIAAMSARGLDVAVIEIPTPVPSEVLQEESGRLALRLFAMRREAMRDRFAARGVAVVPYDASRGPHGAMTDFAAYRGRAFVHASHR